MKDLDVFMFPCMDGTLIHRRIILLVATVFTYTLREPVEQTEFPVWETKRCESATCICDVRHAFPTNSSVIKSQKDSEGIREQWGVRQNREPLGCDMEEGKCKKRKIRALATKFNFVVYSNSYIHVLTHASACRSYFHRKQFKSFSLMVMGCQP